MALPSINLNVLVVSENPSSKVKIRLDVTVADEMVENVNISNEFNRFFSVEHSRVQWDQEKWLGHSGEHLSKFAKRQGMGI